MPWQVSIALVTLFSWPSMMAPGMQEMIKSAKAIVAFYNCSTKATERLKELQEQLNLPNQKLITDCPTR